MALDDLIRQRRDKIVKWRELGVAPYAYSCDVTHHAADLVARGDQVTQEMGEVVRVAGRILTVRGHGKAGFAHVLDGTGKVQLYFKGDHLREQFQRYELLDVGDWIGVEGPLFRTRTGEITIRVDALELLAKSLRPLPEKWHGLKDPETRFRQRYADLFMNLEVREVFRRRARLIAALRDGLEARDFLEVETPVLQPLYGGAFARPFVTSHHALDMEFYLRISNELYLKRLIVGGFERVYEFSRDFRNEGMDRTHNPEFTMLEFYQAFTDVSGMMELTEALVVSAAQRVCGSVNTTYQGLALDFTPPFPRVSMLDAVSEKVGESVHALDREQLARLAQARNLDVRPGVGAGVLLDALFSELVQPTLVSPTFVIDYPIETSPLARASRENPSVVERFELFAAGMELANAFSEQNDPDAQRRAFEAQTKSREQGDEEAQPMDLDYVRALEYGMPPTGGCGIGIDRLAMLLTDSRSIRDVLLFPALRPEEGAREIEDDEVIEEAANMVAEGGPVVEEGVAADAATPRAQRCEGPPAGSMNYPLWIAARYLHTRRRSGFITVLTGISIGGVALGVTALLTVLAVMNGFENEIQTRIAGTDAHVILLGQSAAGIEDVGPVLERVRAQPGVVGVAPFTYVKAMVFREGLTEGLVVKGVDLAREREVTTIGNHIEPPLDSIPRVTEGGLPGIVLGSELAGRLGARLGQPVVLATLSGAPQSSLGYVPRLREFRLVGIFTSGLYTYDSSFGFTSIGASQQFFQLGTAVTGIEIRLADMFEAPRAASVLLRASERSDLRANNWIELNRNLFTWMKLEKAVMFVILTLIILVAAFSIVSTLFMVVLEKQRDIGVLKSMGASSGAVQRVFLFEGLLIGGSGVGIGVVLAAVLIAVLQRYPFVKLPGDVYFIERLPVRPEMGDFLAVIAAALVLCLTAALYPAWRASRLDPVDAIRRQV